MNTLDLIQEEFRKEERDRLRRNASKILSSKNYVPEESYIAFEKTTFPIRISEHMMTQLSIPAGWRVLLLSPKKEPL